MDAEIMDLKLLGTLENIFTFNGSPGHEIVQVYVGRMTDPRFTGPAEMSALEANGETLKVVWKSLNEFNTLTPLYPDGLLELLK
jgi:hypothetical protein